MSSREPMWYCHECHAEMRPLMMPDPVCASCRGSFVEKIENTEDDPRQFAHEDPGLDPLGHPPGPDDVFTNLQTLIELGMRSRNEPRPPRSSGLTFQVHGPQGTRVIRLGGRASPEPIPTMSDFLGPSGFTPVPPPPGDRRGGIGAPLLAHYLMALLGPHDPRAFGLPPDGRMGDYVFNQDALDQIMTQLMENSNAHRPVPAPEEVVDKLPREVLTEGSDTLQKDCAVCKETFSLTTEDPDEQVVITLPCKHPFHEPCILPWLKSSATCPVCRFALVPQPGQSTPPEAGGSSGSGSSSSPPRPPYPGTRSGPSTSPSDSNNRENNSRPAGSGGGLFQNIYDTLTGHRHSNQNARDRERDRAERDRAHNHNSEHDEQRFGSRSGAQRNSPGSRSPTFFPTHHRRSSSDPRSERRTSSRSGDGNTGGTRSPTYVPYQFTSGNNNPNPNGNTSGSNNSNNSTNRRTSSRANNTNLPGSWGEELD